MGFDGLTFNAPYGDMWRKHRTLFNRQMHKGAISQFENLQYEAVRELLSNLLNATVNPGDHIK